MRSSPRGGLYRLSDCAACDASQSRKNKMKLAFSIGEPRHHVVDQIVSAHFVQTAAKAGIPAGIVKGIMVELLAAGE